MLKCSLHKNSQFDMSIIMNNTLNIHMYRHTHTHTHYVIGILRHLSILSLLQNTLAV